MSIPKYDEMFKEFLQFLADEKEHSFNEVIAYCGDCFGLTPEERKATTSSGGNLFAGRVGWTRTYLKKAGLIISPVRGYFKITDEGKKALKAPVIDIEYLKRFDSFRDFVCPENGNSSNCKGKAKSNKPDTLQSLSPQERIDNAISEINSALADELMEEVLKISPYDFEKLIIKLLIAMGYGSELDNQNATTPKSGDEGIDGILTADKFGFDSIYVQAKRYKDSTIGRPVIQAFAGALMGKGASKGLFITTSQFSKEAIDFANKNLQSKIVLVDRETLAKLMIEYDIGVSTVDTIKIKKVDSDFFTDFD